MSNRSAWAGDRGLFTLTIFLSAALLFLVQPMYGRMVLPLLGGAPAVWATALVFFQAALLAGYAYAHTLGRLSGKVQALVHAALLVGAGLTLPISLSAEALNIDPARPALSLLMLMTVSVGLPFFTLAAHAPLLQRWFSRTSDPSAHDPYFLYAASNAGSILGLLMYPVWLERTLRLGEQSWVWAIGFALLAVLVMACAWRSVTSLSGTGTDPVHDASPPPTLRRTLLWLALAAVPSGLLVSTTTVISTDIAAMPLLWVPPLLLYLLSFVIGFASKPLVRHRTVLWIAPFLVVIGASFVFLPTKSGSLGVFGALTLLLFTVCLVCHGELNAQRPTARHLTRVYLTVSAGGVIGGAFTALLAPVLFDWVWEFPLLIGLGAGLVAAAVARALPGPPPGVVGGLLAGTRWPVIGTIMVSAGALALSYAMAFAPLPEQGPFRALSTVAFVGTLVVLAYVSRALPVRFAWVVVACALAFGGWQQVRPESGVVTRERSFFGIVTIRDDAGSGVRLFVHGTTIHGAQSRQPVLDRVPLTYYFPGTGMAQAVSTLGPDAHIGVIGLGTGATLCHAKPGQRWSVFEIDPLVIDLSITRALFTYGRQCAPGARMIVGDARLKLADEPAGSYDALTIDAFSSDAIPLHLMTREAFGLYKQALKPDGVLLVHISNRYLDLEPVVARLAADSGWQALLFNFRPGSQPFGIYATKSSWIALARTPADLARVGATTAKGWQPLRTIDDQALWTDDFADPLAIIKWPRLRSG